jgi:hypothetical protein
MVHPVPVLGGTFYIFITGNTFVTSESNKRLESSVFGNVCWHSGNY